MFDALLTGEEAAFSVGLDLKLLADDSNIINDNGLGVDAPLVKAMRECRQPIIGAINGFAVTGGLEIALGCDFLYAAESATFADTHAHVGLIPSWGLSQKFPRLVGVNRARELSFTDDFFRQFRLSYGGW